MDPKDALIVGLSLFLLVSLIGWWCSLSGWKVAKDHNKEILDAWRKSTEDWKTLTSEIIEKAYRR